MCYYIVLVTAYILFILYRSSDHPNLHVPAHAFPTRRSSDLLFLCNQNFLANDRQYAVDAAQKILKKTKKSENKAYKDGMFASHRPFISLLFLIRSERAHV